MFRPAIVACLLIVAGATTRADDVPPAILMPPDSFAQAQSDSTPAADLVPTEVANDWHIGIQSNDVSPGLFLDGGVSLLSVNLRGSRATLPQFQPLAPWRVPNLNAAELDGTSGQNNNSTSILSGLRFAAGYRLDDGWGEIIGAARWITGSRERWFANGDPRVAIFYQNEVDKLDQQDEENAGSPPRIELGRPDPFGASHVSTDISVSTLDLAYGNGLYGTKPFELRFMIGARRGSITVDDNNAGFGTAAREYSQFVGFGPMASLYGEWKIFGSAPDADTSIGFFGQAAGSLLFGTCQQIDREQLAFPNLPSYRYAEASCNQTVPTYGVQVGVVARNTPNGAVLVGYEFERWQRPAMVGASRFDLSMHGIFVRCTWNY